MRNTHKDRRDQIERSIIASLKHEVDQVGEQYDVTARLVEVSE